MVVNESQAMAEADTFFTAGVAEAAVPVCEGDCVELMKGTPPSKGWMGGN
ncbi:hypothetical protein [Streptomyces sp. NPDC002221]